MLEKILKKETIDKMIELIADKTAKLIANLARPNDMLDMKKKTLEIELLEMTKKNKIEHHLVSRANPSKWYSKWYKRTSFLRVKIEENAFKDILLNHPEASSAQALQGKWQAYGQMRAARTVARGAVLTTGVLGAILWIYQRYLSKQAEEIDKITKQKEEVLKKIDIGINEQKGLKEVIDKGLQYFSSNHEYLTKVEQELSDTVFSYKVITSKLDVAEAKIKELCGDKQECIKDYNDKKKIAEEETKSSFNDTFNDKFIKMRSKFSDVKAEPYKGEVFDESSKIISENKPTNSRPKQI